MLVEWCVIVCICLLSTLDENVAGACEEGGFVEQEDQDQGQFADQGKPSH